MHVTHKYSPQTIIDAVNKFQQCDYVHPLTCGYSSGHPLLVPRDTDDGVKLVCTRCRWTQDVPEFVVEWAENGGLDAHAAQVEEMLAKARRAYVDPSKPERNCEKCGKPYRGPAVYCSLDCAQADA